MALLQGSAAPDLQAISNHSAPGVFLAVSTLLLRSSSSTLQKTQGCVPADRFILKEQLTFWQSQTLHKPVKGLIFSYLPSPPAEEVAAQ